MGIISTPHQAFIQTDILYIRGSLRLSYNTVNLLWVVPGQKFLKILIINSFFTLPNFFSMKEQAWLEFIANVYCNNYRDLH